MPLSHADQVRIATAMKDRSGRLVADIDPDADAAVQDQRNRVRITLRDYQPHYALDVEAQTGEACRRFRAELEQALRGPARVLDALRAITNAREGAIYTLTKEEQALAAAWPTAMARAIAAGRRGLDDVPGAWFDVKLHNPPRETAAPAPAAPPVDSQGSLF